MSTRSTCTIIAALAGLICCVAAAYIHFMFRDEEPAEASRKVSSPRSPSLSKNVATLSFPANTIALTFDRRHTSPAANEDAEATTDDPIQRTIPRDIDSQTTEPREYSDISVRLNGAETHEEMADLAVKIAESGIRNDILALFAAIESASGDDRDTLARSLQALSVHDIGTDLLALLIRNVDDPIVADQACVALARLIEPEDIQQISLAIPSDPEQVILRSYLIQTLSLVNTPASVDALFNLYARSEDPAICSSVSRALGSIGTPEAVESLLVLIQDSGIEDLNDPLSQALASVANKDSRLLLQDEFVNATNPVIQYATAYALASLSNQASQTQAFSAAEHP